MVALRSHMVAPHVPIVVAGESATAMYFIVSGLAKETGPGRGKGRPGSSTLGPGDAIAADALLNGTPHECTVFAHTPMRLLALGNQDLVVLLRKFPRLRRKIQKSAVLRPKKFRKQVVPEDRTQPPEDPVDSELEAL
jgi:CRP-like cAMP-binding protein